MRRYSRTSQHWVMRESVLTTRRLGSVTGRVNGLDHTVTATTHDGADARRRYGRIST